MIEHHSLQEQKEAILLLIEYAAPEDHKNAAKKMVEHYQGDRIALNLLHEFYSFLPEAEDDFIKTIQLLDNREGVFLLLITSSIERYLYMASLDSVAFLGKLADGIWDKEALEYFKLTHEESCQRFKKPEMFPEYTSLDQSTVHCKICSAAIGEQHRLGCPVEICPWCAGQLTTCNCRFTQLGKDKIKTQKDLKMLQEKLAEKGRIPFEVSQQPGGMLE